MLHAAVLGFGTVGSGVAEVLAVNAAGIAQRLGQELDVKYILCRSEHPESPFASKIIHDFSVIEADPEITLVAECIGGATVAYDYVKRALLAGKHVVTSNKELVATRGYELMRLAKERNLNFLFEAAVGGGIPVLRPLYFDLAGNEITQVAGIINGTTNFILTKMLREGASFADVLKTAQELGYAEADPTADVEGLDACRKVCILAALAFGHHVYPEMVPTEGITGITPEDVAAASAAGMQIKLLGRALRAEDGRLCCFVAPHFVAADCQLSGVHGVFNAVLIRGNAVNETMLYGPGAGKLPTASAVVGDLCDCAWHLAQRRPMDWQDAQPEQMADVRNVPLAYVIAAQAEQAQVEAAFGPAKPLPGSYWLLEQPVTRAALEESSLNITAIRPVMR